MNFVIQRLSSQRNLGFQIYARPYYHQQPDRELTVVGGGVMGGIVFYGYRTNRRSAWHAFPGGIEQAD